jgi:hypothetical protein
VTKLQGTVQILQLHLAVLVAAAAALCWTVLAVSRSAPLLLPLEAAKERAVASTRPLAAAAGCLHVLPVQQHQQGECPFRLPHQATAAPLSPTAKRCSSMPTRVARRSDTPGPCRPASSCAAGLPSAYTRELASPSAAPRRSAATSSQRWSAGSMGPLLQRWAMPIQDADIVAAASASFASRQCT